MSTALLGNLQLKILYEMEGLSPDEIASMCALDATVVRATLAQESKVYRILQRNAPISPQERQEMLEIIKDTARTTECDAVKYRAAQYIYEESLGRNDLGGILTGLKINAELINQGLRRAREAKQSALGEGNNSSERSEVRREEQSLGDPGSLVLDV